LNNEGLINEIKKEVKNLNDIINDQNAFIVSDAVSDAWIDQLMTLIKNPLLVKEKSEQALNDFNQKFDSRVVGHRFVALINSVLK
jgi:glycosyltransferase involved in cell wall biosynthesis